MTILVWTPLALLGILLAWEAVSRVRRRWASMSGRNAPTPDEKHRHHAPEAERRRDLDAAASRADHAGAVGLRVPADPRRRY